MTGSQLKGADDVTKSHCETAHLDKGVDHTDIGTGIEDLVEPCLSVDQLQLIELLVILQERQRVKVICNPKSTQGF